MAQPDNAVPHLLEVAVTIRARQMDWSSYCKAALIIDNDELAIIQAFDKADTAGRAALLESNGAKHASVFIKLLSKISKVETLQYIVTLIDDFLVENPARVDVFRQLEKASGVQAWEPFVRIIERKEDAYLIHQANRILVRLAVAESRLPDAVKKFYLGWLRDVVKSGDNDSVLLGLASISKLLQNNEYRLAFVEEHGCIDALRILLTPDASIQIQYQAALCFWVMTFNKVVVERLEESTHHVVENIAAVLKQAKKEKIVRVCISALRNLTENAEEPSTSLAHAVSMVSFKLLPFISNIVNTKPYADEELLADAEFILTKLNTCHEHMSTFDEYSTELKSGHLEWSPVHKSERFWRENAAKLNDNKHALIKILVGLLQSSTDPTVIAVAAHDIGEYVRYYPRGKDVIEKWGGKALIMKNLQHDDAVVRYESLIAVQKLMTHNWEYLGKKAQAAAEGETASA